MFYTYVLIDPQNGFPFYVGKGTKLRMYEHEKRGNSRVKHYVQKIKAAGLRVIYEKWFESEDEDFCFWMEIYLIDYFGRENLCNLARGGEGPSLLGVAAIKLANTGRKHSEEEKQKRNESRKHFFATPEGILSRKQRGIKVSAFLKALGENHPCKRPEIRLKIGESGKGRIPPNKGQKYPGQINSGSFKTGKPSPNKGKALSAEQRSEMSKLRQTLGTGYWQTGHSPFKGKQHTAEANQKNREAHLGSVGHWKNHRFSEEHKAKIRIAKLGKPGPWKGKTFSEEHRAKLRQARQRYLTLSVPHG